MKKQTINLDGFAGYSDAVEGSDEPPRQDMGIKLKYIDPKWYDPDENEFREPLIVLDVLRRAQKWIDGMPVDTIVAKPGEPFPDVAALNAKCPQSEWRDAFGKWVGPWQNEHVVLFFHEITMVGYWWPSPLDTIGSAICVREIVKLTERKRRITQQPMYAEVELTRTFMNTDYGGLERPQLKVKGWKPLGPASGTTLSVAEAPLISGPATVAAPTPTKPKPAETKPATKIPSATISDAPSKMRSTAESTLGEETKDAVPF